VSFFEAPPPRPEPAQEPEPVLPPWFGPPQTVLGVAVPIHRILARTDPVVAALVGMVAYPTGCTFELDLAARRTGQDMAAWDTWNAAFFGEKYVDGSVAGRSHRAERRRPGARVVALECPECVVEPYLGATHPGHGHSGHNGERRFRGS
jgi:hypothetical protein